MKAVYLLAVTQTLTEGLKDRFPNLTVTETVKLATEWTLKIDRIVEDAIDDARNDAAELADTGPR